MSARRITDPDVQVLAGIASTLRVDYAADLEWEGSPFAWIRERPSRQRGKIGEQMIAGWLAARDFTVGPSPDSQADRVINGVRAEVKFSTRWQSGVYKFQQLRDQDYQFVICLGVCPFDARCWAIPKDQVLKRWKDGPGSPPSTADGKARTPPG